jgi:hypothetical protein
MTSYERGLFAKWGGAVVVTRASRPGRRGWLCYDKSHQRGGFACTEIDLFDLFDWLNGIAPHGIDVDGIARALALFATRKRSGRH